MGSTGNNQSATELRATERGAAIERVVLARICMRVIHLMNHCRFGHGNVHAGVDLACAQAARGDVVCFASGGGEFAPFLEANKVRHVVIDQENRRPSDVFRMTRQLQRLVREFKPDILHAHMMTGAAIGWLVGRLNNIKLVATAHNAFEKHAVIMRLADRIVAVSQGSAEELIRRGFPRKRMRVVLNGNRGAVRRDFFPRQTYSLKHPNIGSIGGLHERKGIPDLINAFAAIALQHPAATLYIAGDGPSRREYETLAAASPGAGQIKFLGEVRDTKSFFESIDIFALSSHSEPFGLVITEAREGGCAVVATNVGGVPEAVGVGRGILVPPREPDLLAQAFSTLLDSPDELQRMRALASEDLDQWNIDRVAADYNAVYLDALK
jgi:glycosyltransferase involved in cell wall biosynthesis